MAVEPPVEAGYFWARVRDRIVWPDTDEDELRRYADQWRDAAERFLLPFTEVLGQHVPELANTWTDAAGVTFREVLAEHARNARRPLEHSVAVVADSLYKGADRIEMVKRRTRVRVFDELDAYNRADADGQAALVREVVDEVTELNWRLTRDLAADAASR